MFDTPLALLELAGVVVADVMVFAAGDEAPIEVVDLVRTGLKKQVRKVGLYS